MPPMTYHLDYKVTGRKTFVGHVREYPGIIVQADTLEALQEEAKKGVQQYQNLYEDQPVVTEPMISEQVQIIT